MASMVISDAVTDTACFPYTMLAGNAHQTSSTAPAPVYRSTPTTRSHSHSQPHTPQSPTPQQLHHSFSQPSHSLRATPDTLAQNGAPPSTQYAPNPPYPESIPSSHPDAAPYSEESIRRSFASQQDSPHPAGSDQSSRRSTQDFDQLGNAHLAAPRGFASSPASPRLQPSYISSRSLAGSAVNSPSRIKVRDINHIHSFASEELLSHSRQGEYGRIAGLKIGQQYEISSMPVTDIIEMVAGLLTKITTTNDRQHEHLHRHIPPPDGTTGLSQQTTSVLAFHGKNVPSITILNYMSRIHKYCPTTYEVFLSLLVYFDRMTEMVNNGSVRSLRQTARQSGEYRKSQSGMGRMSLGDSTASAEDAKTTRPLVVTPPSSGSLNVQDPSAAPPSPIVTAAGPSLNPDPTNLSHFFVVDSFNIHRLVIAGVTCASKFFSDVFYTNSRYAKVRPRPSPAELKHRD
jgi:hypothetical protein